MLSINNSTLYHHLRFSVIAGTIEKTEIKQYNNRSPEQSIGM